MSIKGIRLSDGTVEKYGFPYLDDIDVQLQHLGSDVLSVLNNKADIDGSYINLNAGTANNLNSSVGIEDSVPYTFRTSGGSVDIGDRMNLKSVVGGTVAWNQLATIPSSNKSKTQNGVTITDNRDGSFTVSTDANGATADTYLVTGTGPVIKDHKYLFKSAPVGGSISTFYAYAAGSGIVENRTDLGNGCIQKCLSSGTTSFVSVYIVGGAVITTPIKFVPQYFDLTAMFGSTIADYIYALEQSNAGAGVAYFRKLFPKPYYAYNSSEMLSARTNLHKMVGFNQFDKSKAVNGKRFNTTGITNVSTAFSRTDWIRVIPNTTYYFKDMVGRSDMYAVYWYDADKNYITSDGISGASPKSGYFTSPANAYYVGVNFRAVDIDSVCVSLRWDGERDGEYEPFVSHEYALSDITLRGMLILDANNNLHADGDRYLPDGTVERRAVEIEITSCDSVATSSAGAKYAQCALQKAAITESASNNFVSNGYVFRANAPSDGGKWFRVTSNKLYIFDERFTDKATADSILASEKPHFVYITATTTTETASPYQQTQIVDDFGTEEFVDAAVEANERDVAIPVGHETFYQNNLKAKLEMAPNSPDGDGLYVVQQISGANTYVPLVVPNEIPDAPTTDGTYVLKASVSDGTVTYSWVAE